MKVKLTASQKSYLGFFLLLPISAITQAEPAAFGAPLPGDVVASAEVEWLSPRVLAIRRGIETEVRWYDDAGNIIQQLSGANTTATKECVTTRSSGARIIYGLDSLWKLDLSTPDHRDDGSTRVLVDAETLAEQYPFSPETSKINVYHAGKLVGSVGPFLNHRDSNMRMESGRLRLITWGDKERAFPEVVVIGKDGELKIRAKCHDDDISPFPLADDKTVLVEVDGLTRPPVRYRSLQQGREPIVIDLDANARPLTCVPGGDLVVFRTISYTNEIDVERILLLHGETGRILWNVETPVRPQLNASTQAVVFQNRLFLLGLDMAELSLENGSTLAFWRSQSPSRAWTQFFPTADRLFVGTRNMIYELSLPDITAKRKGWQ